jgi:hypothetical protein
MNRQIITVFAAAILCAGCAGIDKGRPVRPAYEDAHVKRLNAKYAKDDAIPLDSAAITEEKRNEILDDLTYLIDVNYAAFETELQRSKAMFDTGSDLVLLGLGAAGSVHPAGTATKLLAAASGGISGARSSINKNFLHERSIQALTAQMRAARAKRLELIRKGMTLRVTDYSLSRGLSDLVTYYNSGTLLGALTEITAEAGEKEKQATKATEGMIEVSYAEDAATKPLRERITNWLLADADQRVPQLQAWLAARTPPVTLTPTFWVDSDKTTVAELLEAILHFNMR